MSMSPKKYNTVLSDLTKTGNNADAITHSYLEVLTFDENTKVVLPNGQEVDSLNARLKNLDIKVSSDLVYDKNNIPQSTINDLKVSTFESVDDMIKSTYKYEGAVAITKSYHKNKNIGGSIYIYDSSKLSIDNGITIIKGWCLVWDKQNLNVMVAGCKGNGTEDDGVIIQKILDIFNENGGGILNGSNKTYLVNNNNFEINTDNVFIVDMKFKRTSLKTGWIFRTATTKDIFGGGFINVSGTGVFNNVSGNAFINMGTNSYKHSNWVLKDIIADSFAQYGVGINGGDNWNATNIKVTNHGPVTGILSACMGFYVFPRVTGRPSSGGILNGVYSELSAGAQANANLNSAAIKLQAHDNAKFSNITAIGGYEQCLGIDSVGGFISNATVMPQGERIGLNLGNYNSAHESSGQIFTIENVNVIDAVGSSGTYAMVIDASEDSTLYKLTGCTIRNVKARRFKSLSNTAFKDCVFENILCEDIRISTAYQNIGKSTVKSVNNIFKNVRASTTVCAIEADNSEFIDCGTLNKNTATGVVIIGSNNIIRNLVAYSDVTGLAFRSRAATNSNDFDVTSYNNIVIGGVIKANTNAVQCFALTGNNIIYAPICLNKSDINNTGDATNVIKTISYV